jgi:prepilin-type N-terminal cleavage/methylation domain-containing protein
MKITRNQKGLALSSSKGFTLIEVVLVLAIGGLIFLLAFLAFQQVSVNRRDTARRSDAGRLVAELENYNGDKNSYPTSSAASTDSCTTTTANSFGAFLNTYVCKGSPKAFEGPQGAYTIADGVTAANVGSTLLVNNVRYNKNANCAKGSTGVSVEIGLEKGIACRDNQ